MDELAAHSMATAAAAMRAADELLAGSPPRESSLATASAMCVAAPVAHLATTGDVHMASASPHAMLAPPPPLPSSLSPPPTLLGTLVTPLAPTRLSPSADYWASASDIALHAPLTALDVPAPAAAVPAATFAAMPAVTQTPAPTPLATSALASGAPVPHTETARTARADAPASAVVQMPPASTAPSTVATRALAAPSADASMDAATTRPDPAVSALYSLLKATLRSKAPDLEIFGRAMYDTRTFQLARDKYDKLSPGTVFKEPRGTAAEEAFERILYFDPAVESTTTLMERVNAFAVYNMADAEKQARVAAQPVWCSVVLLQAMNTLM